MSRNLILENEEETFCLKDLRKALKIKEHYMTLYLWCKRGVSRGLPRPIKMESIRAPRGIRSSVEAYHRFMAALNQDE